MMRNIARYRCRPVRVNTAPAALQRKAGPEARAGHAAGRATDAVSSGGQALTQSDRAFFEPRFGRDLGHVRIHSNGAAARAAAGIGALAYTHRNHIAFADGAYRPGDAGGRRLLAHELAHTMQQGSAGTIRRTCPTDPAQIPAGGSADFEREVDAIHAHAAYQALGPRAKAKADHIIDGARGSACPMYYINLLRLLFDTPVNTAAQTTGAMRQRSVDAAAAEQQRLQDPVWAALTNVEETATASASRSWRTATGFRGTTYRIDDSDLTRIYVHMKVHPRAAGTGTATDVARTVGLEDGIETEALTEGYMLDVEFVTRSGPDVFDVGVDPSGWITAGNWVGEPEALAHEAHHLLGLEDRYDYTTHADNEDMQIATRLHWFREQMVRAADPLSPQSMMDGGESTAAMNEQDICALASGDFRTCLVTRFAMRPANEIETVADGLSSPYRPQHGALLQVLSDAWMRRPMSETTANCDASDPLCGLPPIGVFHDSNITAMDAARFPLANPHDQPAGSTLTRTRRRTP